MLYKERNSLLMQRAIKVPCMLVSGRERLLTFLCLAAGSAGCVNREQALVPSITRLQWPVCIGWGPSHLFMEKARGNKISQGCLDFSSAYGGVTLRAKFFFRLYTTLGISQDLSVCCQYTTDCVHHPMSNHLNTRRHVCCCVHFCSEVTVIWRI